MKRSYTKEFKVKACELVLKDGLKPSIVAEKLGIHHVMLYRWVDEYQTYGDEAFVGKGHLSRQMLNCVNSERRTSDFAWRMRY